MGVIRKHFGSHKPRTLMTPKVSATVGVAAIQLRGACNVYGGEVRVRKMQWPARLEGPARIAAVCGKVSYSLGNARCAF